MSRDRRLRHAKTLDKLAHGQLARVLEELQYAKPGRVAETSEVLGQEIRPARHLREREWRVVGPSVRAAAEKVDRRRDIGPIGTASRIAGGVIAIALPIALGGFGCWDAAAALVVLPLIATAASMLITASYRRHAPQSLAERHAICSGPSCWLIATTIAAAVALDALTPTSGEVAFWVWLGASMLLAAARGYGGCEVLAVPNLVTGRRDEIGCLLYSPIDRAEARRRTEATGRRVHARQ